MVLRIKTSAGNRRDSAGNPTVNLKVIGTGQATVLRDGQRFRATESMSTVPSTRPVCVVWVSPADILAQRSVPVPRPVREALPGLRRAGGNPPHDNKSRF